MKVKVLALKPDVRRSLPRRSGSAKEGIASIGVVPDAMGAIFRRMEVDLPKAYATMVYLANRNKEGLTPTEWYEQMSEALGIRPEDLENEWL